MFERTDILPTGRTVLAWGLRLAAPADVRQIYPEIAESLNYSTKIPAILI